MLPANLAVATPGQIRRLILALIKQTPAVGAHPAHEWLLQIVLGMSAQEWRHFPVWSESAIKRPPAGQIFTKSLTHLNRDGIWQVPDGVWLQRFIEVANSRVNNALSRILPSVDLFLLLPLPSWTVCLLGPGNRHRFKERELDASLAAANYRAGTGLTRRQLQSYFQAWLLRAGGGQRDCRDSEWQERAAVFTDGLQPCSSGSNPRGLGSLSGGFGTGCIRSACDIAACLQGRGVATVPAA